MRIGGRGTKEVPMLRFCCVFNLWVMSKLGTKRGWVGRKRRSGCGSDRGVAEGRGGQKEQLVMGRAVSWQELR